MGGAIRPRVEESAEGVVLDNGRLHLEVSPALGGRLTALRLDGHELLGPRRTGRFDQVVRVLEPELALPAAEPSWSVRELEDAVLLEVRVPPTTAMPCTAVRSYLLAAEQTCVHLASRFEHAAEHPAVALDQHRVVCWLDPEIFTHIDLEDDAFGTPWRAEASRLPTPEDLRRGRTVMDATTDLAGTGSASARRHHTKYDWAVSLRDHAVHGLHGHLDGRRVGAYAVLADRSTFNGGPDRQDLTAHQTEDGPVLLLEPQATHYGSRPVLLRGESARTYGPMFLHLGWAEVPDGDDAVDAPGAAARLRAQAMAHLGDESAARLYDRAKPAGWVPSGQRVRVQGTVTRTGAVPEPVGPAELSAAGVLVILSESGVDAQDTAGGCQHWTGLGADGGFRLDGVRPGTYRLTLREDGVWDEHVVDPLVITEDTSLDLHWHRPEPTEVLWRIGSPDGTSLPFTGAAAARRFASTAEYPELFPVGITHDVDDPEAPWYFTQPQTTGAGPGMPWRIRFTLDEAPAPSARPRLRLALAAWSLTEAVPNPGVPSTLSIQLGEAAPILWEFSGDDARGAVYRSAAWGRRFRRDLVLDPGLLRAGENVLTLAVNPGGALAVQATWDALQLELA
ncbi:polysaccharide lyase family protein [Brachybacterium sp. YJGR34]|uniref:polysaccharide lyase family protein n=1 Tax=Brachybacterium sp. YJGR34 TaxID=2059911 RepID=UPI000E0BA621|nr:polysaccharide lyase family protein [Brachybacterium sp. YJGR34]